MSAMFHPRCGRCVQLSNGNKTACRINPTQEFNRGLIFSLEPIKDNEIFEVKIDKKLNTWSGSVEIGVTVCNPDVIDIPITATDLRGGTWIMLGQGVLRDGRSLHEAYGCDLDKLVEGDRVGVMRTSNGDLKFFVNGDCQGIAATNLPQILYACVDMYGKCAQITLTNPTTPDSNEDSISEISSLRDSNIIDSQTEQLSVTNTTQINQISSSALSNHVANISIANSLMSNSDSNVLTEREGAESSTDITDHQDPIPLSPTSLPPTGGGSPYPDSGGGERDGGGGGERESREGRESNEARRENRAAVRANRSINGLSGIGNRNNCDINNTNLSSNNTNEIVISSNNQAPGLSCVGAVGGNINNNNNNGTNNNLTRNSNINDINAGPSRNNNNSNNNNNNNNNNVNNNGDNMTNYTSLIDRLRFHDKCGTLVKLTNTGRTAERRRPLDEFNNGVVMSYRSLRADELFEIRIDRLVDKWSGSIEVGITTHNPDDLDFPATMTNMRSGTTMMSGTGILTNGKGTHREYGEFNLDELKEGDRIGMMIKSNGELHYYINGQDQGIASPNVPLPVWSVVDLYGMTVKVTVVDRDEREEQNLMTRRNAQMADAGQPLSDDVMVEDDIGETLLFHNNCGTYAEVICGGRTAHRPNASDDFNNGVVLTRRYVKSNEMFEVRLDKCVDKWAGSLEIGLTTHPPTDLEYPSTMTNVRSGTWMMTGNGVMHNGTTVIDDYGLNLDRLKVGDRVGVIRKDNGNLYFYVNGVDQGLAATNVPDNVYGVVDLYGQAAQATIIQHSEHTSSDVIPSSLSSSTIYSDLRFNHMHGKNARIISGGLTAQRPNAHGEFNDAIVISNRQLHDGEMFEVMIDKVVDRWSGSLEAGMTAIPPEEIEFPSTMTDIDYDTWMLSGSSVMRDGITVMNNYRCDLDSLGIGTRIGMMRHADGTLHYYVNGEDQGSACENLPQVGLWAVIDLYGQCAQVTIVHNPIRHDQSLISVSQYLDMSHLSLHAPGLVSTGTEVLHRFSKCYGANITLSNNNTKAVRTRNYNHALVFTSHPLEADELFEVRIEKLAQGYCGSIGIGLTSLPVSDSLPTVNLPASLSALDAADTWYVSGCDVRRNGGSVTRLNFCPSLGRLMVFDSVGIKKTSDGAMRLYINGEDFGIAATNVTKRVFGVVDLFGCAESVVITSVSRQASTPVVIDAQATNNAVSQDSLELSQVDSRTPLEIARDTDVVGQVQIVDPRTNGSLTTTELATSESTNRPHSQPQQLLHNQQLQQEALSENNKEIELQFHENHGKNIQLSSERTVARRVESYNQGIIMSSKTLPRNVIFQVGLGQLNPRWSSSLIIGVTAQAPDKLHLPNTAFALKRNTWCVAGDSVFYNGVKIKGRYGPDLDSLAGGSGGHLVGIMVDAESRLHLLVNGIDQGVAAKEIPNNVYVVIDLYGQCQEVVLSSSGLSAEGPIPQALPEKLNKKNLQKSQQHNLQLQQSDNNLSAVSAAHQMNVAQQQQQQQQQQTSLPASIPNQPQNNTNSNISTSVPSNTLSYPSNTTSLTSNSVTNTSISISNTSNTLSISSNTITNTSVVNITNTANSYPNLVCDPSNTSSNEINESLRVNPPSNQTTEHRVNAPSNQTTEHISQLQPAKDKEKGLSRTLQDTLVKNCEYQKMCARFKSSLTLPEGYFSSEGQICYCETCHKIRGDEPFYTKGSPPKQYAQPFGWCRFALVSGVGDNNESWHMAYHGTRPGAIRRMLDKGELLTSGELGIGSSLAGRRSKDDDSDGSQLCFSPAIMYASDDHFAPPRTFIDPCSGRSVGVRVVLQVAVEPGSYKVGPPSITWSQPSLQHNNQRGPQPYGKQETIEWVTKERGATQLLALLINIEEEK